MTVRYKPASASTGCSQCCQSFHHSTPGDASLTWLRLSEHPIGNGGRHGCRGWCCFGTCRRVYLGWERRSHLLIYYAGSRRGLADWFNLCGRLLAGLLQLQCLSLREQIYDDLLCGEPLAGLLQGERKGLHAAKTLVRVFGQRGHHHLLDLW